MRAGPTRPGLVLLTVAVGRFLAVGSASIVSVALPTIARDLGATAEQQQILGTFAVGAGALAAFIGWERRREEPLVDVGLFRVPAFVAANAAGLIVFFALIGATVCFSAYFQQVQARGPVEAGLCVLPLGAGVALVLALVLVPRAGSGTP